MSAPNNHTPGPWIADVWGDIWAETGVHRCGEMTVDVCRKPEAASAEQWRANALLITAAPDLLERLKQCAEVLSAEGGHEGGLWLDEIRAAIAKAEGRE